MRALLVLGLGAVFVTATARVASAQSSQNERATAGAAVVTPLPGAEVLPYENGKPVPPGYHIVQSGSTGIAVFGGVVFGFSYGATALAGLFLSALSQAFDDKSSNYALLLVPGVGPFALMFADGRYNDGLMFLGGAQLAGLGLMAFGAATPPRITLVRDLALRTAAPVALPGGGGFSVAGTF